MYCRVVQKHENCQGTERKVPGIADILYRIEGEDPRTLPLLIIIVIAGRDERLGGKEKK